MRYSWMICLFVLFFVGRVEAQCPVDTLILNSQSQIDQFSTNYPNCTELKFPLTITGAISNLAGLDKIVKATIIKVDGTSKLSSLKGLGNLESINEIRIKFNSDLLEIDGNNKLEQAKLIEISNNINLIQVTGFNVLNECKELIISNNTKLENIIGFNKIKLIDSSLKIENNPVLTEISAFNNLKEIKFNISITNIGLHGLMFLSNLERTSYLQITNNKSLRNTDALSSLKQLFRLDIYQNDSLENISKFSPIDVRFINIFRNPRLIRIECFDSLISLKILQIESNDLLEAINCFKTRNLSLDELRIENNNSLISIDNFHLIQAVKNLLIYNNNKLRNFNLPKDLTQIDIMCEIRNNSSLESIDFTHVVKSDQVSFIIEKNNKLIEIKLPNFQNPNYFYLAIYDNEQLQRIVNDSILKANAIEIVNNPNLMTFDFISTNSIDYLYLRSNNSLLDLFGFINLESAKSIIIEDNNELENLNGLDGLLRCENFTIKNNNSLVSFFSINHSYIQISDLTIDNNAEITDITTLGTVGELKNAIISGNSKLESINLKCNYFSTSNLSLTIKSNPILKYIYANVIQLNELTIENNNKLPAIGLFHPNININAFKIINNKSLKNITLSGINPKINHLTIDQNDSIEFINLPNDFNYSEPNLIVTNNIKLEKISLAKVAKMGNFFISNNQLLKTIELDSLRVVHGLTIENNSSLKDLNGFVNVKQTQDLNILNNDRLISLNGFINLKSVYGELIISYNNALVSLFDNLSHTTGFTITNNPELTDISGLRNVDISANVSIVNNPNLSNCDILSICKSFDNNAIKYFYANNLHCKNANEVKEQCNKKSANPHPNPAHNTINFALFTVKNEATVTIYDIHGRQVQMIKTTQPELDISALNAGTYILQVESKDINYKKTFIKF